MLKNSVSKLLMAILVFTLILSNGFFGGISTYANEEIKKPKYVFYFIGDGLGASQRQAAEFYLQELNLNKEKLFINSMDIAGINTTYSKDSLVTDSAAAGTALATGYKTNNGMISVLPDGKKLKTLIEEAKQNNMATGIISTTRLTHATPAVFVSHNISRNNENEIAKEMAEFRVDFLAGGGYRHFVTADYKGLKSKRTDENNLVEFLKKNDYNVFLAENSTKDFIEFNPSKEEKVFAVFTYSHLPYEVDRRNNNETPSLSKITKKGIEVLEQYDDGFFMMIEAGRIDHAGHANDAKGTIMDVIEFDNSVKQAYEFYKNHKDETLIVVVGDHETGGMGLGFGKNYFLDMAKLQDVKVSVEDKLQGKYNGNKDEYKMYIKNNLGIDNLTKKEEANLNRAMNIVDNKLEEDKNLYGGYDPVAIETTHIISKRANIEWTTYAHTGTSIPMSAIGVGSQKFSGYKDNTQIAKTMAELLNFDLN
ncbi:MAG: alkaline phosphatase [Peptostreptococcaceae bacterium]|jgi:alkaline phosphatase|nr:alkaline phosphatase [Peptostreptococcaceae bacterium]